MCTLATTVRQDGISAGKSYKLSTTASDSVFSILLFRSSAHLSSERIMATRYPSQYQRTPQKYCKWNIQPYNQDSYPHNPEYNQQDFPNWITTDTSYSYENPEADFQNMNGFSNSSPVSVPTPAMTPVLTPAMNPVLNPATTPVTTSTPPVSPPVARRRGRRQVVDREDEPKELKDKRNYARAYREKVILIYF